MTMTVEQGEQGVHVQCTLFDVLHYTHTHNTQSFYGLLRFYLGLPG